MTFELFGSLSSSCGKNGRGHEAELSVVPVILSGGDGSRLWPLTGPYQPKPFLPVPSGKTLFADTLERAAMIAEGGDIATVTLADHAPPTLSAWEYFSGPGLRHHLILEPFGKDTAPAFASALRAIGELHGEDALAFLLPADHIVIDSDAFTVAAKEAIALARTGVVTLLGITPRSPNTGYGYIEAKDQKVVGLHEKPNRSKAGKFFKSGHHFWNSGMLCGTVASLKALYRQHCPKILLQSDEAFAEAYRSGRSGSFLYWLQPYRYGKTERGPLDRLILERAAGLGFIQANFDWRDIGSWDAYWRLFEADASGNVAGPLGFAEDSNNCFIYSGDRPVVTLGVNNLAVINAGEGILVTNRENAEQVRRIADRVRNGKQHSPPRREIRPWGEFEVLEERDDYKVKRLKINPGESTSLQSHRHRCEHWIVVTGEARARIDREEITLSRFQTASVTAGVRHAIANPSAEPLVIIETQSGSYLGEDDEIRYEDRYGRR